MGKPVNIKQFKMGIHRHLITKPGDREVKGQMVQWRPGINTLAKAFEEAEKRGDEQSTSRLRGDAFHKKGR